MADENKAMTLFASVKQSAGKGDSGNIIKALESGFKDLKNSLNKTIVKLEKTSSKASNTSTNDSNKQINHFNSIDKSLKSLVQIEARNEKRAMASMDKNRFSVKKEAKANSDAKASGGKGGAGGSGFSLKAMVLGLAFAFGTQMSDTFASLLKGGGMIVKMFKFDKVRKYLTNAFKFGKIGKKLNILPRIKKFIQPVAKIFGAIGKFIPKITKMFGFLGKAGGAAAKGGGAIAKIAGKLGLSFLKKIPGLGLIIGVALGAKKIVGGDIFGGLLEIGSGIASTIPGVGTLVSLAIDAFSIFRDSGGVDELMSDKPSKLKSFGVEVMRNVPIVGTFIRMKEALALWKSGDKLGAIKEGAKALAVMIPGAGLIIGIAEQFSSAADFGEGLSNFGNKALDFLGLGSDSKTPQDTSINKSAASKDGKVSKPSMARMAKDYKTKLNVAKEQGDTEGIAFWQGKQDSLIALSKNDGTIPTKPEDEVQDPEKLKATEDGLTPPEGYSKNQLKRTIKSLSSLNPKFQPAAMKLVQAAWDQGLPVTVTEGARGEARQNMLKAAGRSNAKFGSSYHNYGMAIDMAMATGDAYDTDRLTQLGALGKKMGFTWGGDFKTLDDKPHFESPIPLASVKATELPMAQHGLFTNQPAIFGEAGPEFAIPFNGEGIGYLAQALNKAINLTGGESDISGATGGGNSEKLKEFLNNQFIPKLATAMATAMKSNSGSNGNSGSVMNAFS